MILYVFLFGLFILAVALFPARHKKWSPIFWLPLAAISVYGSFFVLRVMEAHGGEGMEALGSLFALLLGWPFFVLAIAALVAFPRKWETRPIIIGSGLTAIIAVGFHLSGTRPQTVQVIGENSVPVPGVICTGGSSIYGIDRNLGPFTTDKAGKFKFRRDPGESVKLEIAGSRDYYSTTLYISSSTEGSDKSVPRSVRTDWGPFESNRFYQSAAYFLPNAPDEPVLLFLKRKDHLVSIPLREHIRSFLHLVREKGVYVNSLEYACRNPESLELIDEIADLIPISQPLQGPAINGLTASARELHGIHRMSEIVCKKRVSMNINEYEQIMYIALCEWAGVTAMDDVELSRSMIDKKIKGYADKLIVRSQPYWTDENHSVHVLSELRELGRPAIPLLFEASSRAHPRAREAILHGLWNFHPTLDEVSLFVSSNDPELVVAGYWAVKDSIPDNEKQLARKRLENLSRPESDTRVQRDITSLLSSLRDE